MTDGSSQYSTNSGRSDSAAKSPVREGHRPDRGSPGLPTVCARNITARSVDHEPVGRRRLCRWRVRVSKRWMPRSLDDVPDRLILFDWVCVLCCWWVRFVIERDASARFRFVTIQSTRGSALATRLAVGVASPGGNGAITNGHAYFKSDAMILVLAGLPGWSWSRIFLLLPRRVRDWAYDRIARNRYRLFGRNESCLVLTSAIAARFVLDDPSGEQP